MAGTSPTPLLALGAILTTPEGDDAALLQAVTQALGHEPTDDDIDSIGTALDGLKGDSALMAAEASSTVPNGRILMLEQRILMLLKKKKHKG